MNKKVIVTLYHADWCGYCVKLMPEWNIFEKSILNMKNNYNGIPIEIKEYEHAKLSKLGGGTINGIKITGYPTIKIKLISGKEEKEYDYEKYINKKKEKYMTNFIKNICNELKKY